MSVQGRLAFARPSRAPVPSSSFTMAAAGRGPSPTGAALRALPSAARPADGQTCCGPPNSRRRWGCGGCVTSSIRRSGGCSTAPRGAARHAACESCFRPRRRRGAACQTARRTPASRVQHRPPPTSVCSSWLQLGNSVGSSGSNCIVSTPILLDDCWQRRSGRWRWRLQH